MTRKKNWKYQPIGRLWKDPNHPGSIRSSIWKQTGRNCSNLLVLSTTESVDNDGRKTDGESSVEAPPPTPSSSVSDKHGNSTSGQKSEKAAMSKCQEFPRSIREKDLDEISDSPLEIDDASAENWEKISEGSLQDFHDHENELQLYSDQEECIEFYVGYRSCAPKYLKMYHPLQFFRPKFFVMSDERFLVSCMSVVEKPAWERGDLTNKVNECQAKDSSTSEIDELGFIQGCEPLSDSDTENVGSSSDKPSCKDQENKPSEECKIDSTVVNGKDVFQGSIKLQDALDNLEEPVIGLEYLVEVWEEFDSDLDHYSCELCEKQFDEASILTHLLSDSHKVAYVVKRLPSQSSEFAGKCIENLSGDVREKVKSLCKEICEKSSGNVLPYITTKHFIAAHGTELKSVINQSANSAVFGQNSSEANKIGRLSSSPPNASCKSAQAVNISDVASDAESSKTPQMISGESGHFPSKSVLPGQKDKKIGVHRNYRVKKSQSTNETESTASDMCKLEEGSSSSGKCDSELKSVEEVCLFLKKTKDKSEKAAEQCLKTEKSDVGKSQARAHSSSKAKGSSETRRIHSGGGDDAINLKEIKKDAVEDIRSIKVHHKQHDSKEHNSSRENRPDVSKEKESLKGSDYKGTVKADDGKSRKVTERSYKEETRHGRQEKHRKEPSDLYPRVSRSSRSSNLSHERKVLEDRKKLSENRHSRKLFSPVSGGKSLHAPRYNKQYCSSLAKRSGYWEQSRSYRPHRNTAQRTSSVYVKESESRSFSRSPKRSRPSDSKSHRRLSRSNSRSSWSSRSPSRPLSMAKFRGSRRTSRSISRSSERASRSISRPRRRWFRDISRSPRQMQRSRSRSPRASRSSSVSSRKRFRSISRSPVSSRRRWSRDRSTPPRLVPSRELSPFSLGPLNRFTKSITEYSGRISRSSSRSRFSRSISRSPVKHFRRSISRSPPRHLPSSPHGQRYASPLSYVGRERSRSPVLDTEFSSYNDSDLRIAGNVGPIKHGVFRGEGHSLHTVQECLSEQPYRDSVTVLPDPMVWNTCGSDRRNQDREFLPGLSPPQKFPSLKSTSQFVSQGTFPTNFQNELNVLHRNNSFGSQHVTSGALHSNLPTQESSSMSNPFFAHSDMGMAAVSSEAKEKVFENMRSVVSKLFGKSAGAEFSSEHGFQHSQSSQSVIQQTVKGSDQSYNKCDIVFNDYSNNRPAAEPLHSCNTSSTISQNAFPSVPSIPPSAKVQFKETPAMVNTVNIFPIIRKGHQDGNSEPWSSGSSGAVAYGGRLTSGSSQKLSLAQRLASVLVKLGMVDVPGSLLSEMLLEIGAFNDSLPFRDISETQIISVLKQRGYLNIT